MKKRTNRISIAIRGMRVPEPETEVVIAADAEEGPAEAAAGIAADATDVVEDGMAVAMADTVVRDDKDLLLKI